MTTKLWISDKLELRYSPGGWPVEAFPADREEAEFERKRYAYNLAKAKKESIPVMLPKRSFPGDPFEQDLKPDTFIDYEGEVETDWQFGGLGEIWEDGTEDHCRAMENKGFAIRKIARLKKAENEPVPNGVRTITYIDPKALLEKWRSMPEPESDPGVGQYYEKAHGEIAPINQHVAIGWQQKFGATNSPIIIPEDLQSRLDAANARIKELESNPADVLAAWLHQPGLKARILEAFEKRKWKISEFHNTASDILSEVLDDLGIK